MYHTTTFRITGAAPLLMHAMRLADPIDPLTQAIKRITSKRDKTDADHAEVARLEWLGGLYLHQGEPCLPGENLEAALKESGRKKRKGKQVAAGVFCDRNFPLEYDGPRSPEALWDDPRFRFTTGARVQRQCVMRTRPRFEAWAAMVVMTYNDELLNAGDIRELLQLFQRLLNPLPALLSLADFLVLGSLQLVSVMGLEASSHLIRRRVARHQYSEIGSEETTYLTSTFRFLVLICVPIVPSLWDCVCRYSRQTSNPQNSYRYMRYKVRPTNQAFFHKFHHPYYGTVGTHGTQSCAASLKTYRGCIVVFATLG